MLIKNVKSVQKGGPGPMGGSPSDINPQPGGREDTTLRIISRIKEEGRTDTTLRNIPLPKALFDELPDVYPIFILFSAGRAE